MVKQENRCARLRAAAGTVAAAVLAVTLAACGDGARAPEVATAGGATGRPAASGSAAAGSVAAYVEGQRRLVACLREHGFDVPDPDSRGDIDVSAAMRGRPKTDPKIMAAWEACREFVQPVPAELEEKAPPLTAEQVAHRREYARCMRANGMPRWPDPAPDGSWPEDALAGELSPQEQAANLRALQICEPVLDGRPPTTPNPNATGAG